MFPWQPLVCLLDRKVTKSFSEHYYCAMMQLKAQIALNTGAVVVFWWEALTSHTWERAAEQLCMHKLCV